MKLQIITTDGERVQFPIDKIESIGIIDMSSIGQQILNAVSQSDPSLLVCRADAPTSVAPLSNSVPTEVVDDNIAPVVTETAPIVEQNQIVEEPTVIPQPMPSDVATVESDTVDVVENVSGADIVSDNHHVEQRLDKAVQTACDDVIGELMVMSKPPVTQTRPLFAVSNPNLQPVITRADPTGKPRQVVQLNPTMTEI